MGSQKITEFYNQEVANQEEKSVSAPWASTEVLATIPD